jgi:hypothetical protein
MTMTAAFQRGLMADLGLFQRSPIQVEMDLAAQGLELIQFFFFESIPMPLDGWHQSWFWRKSRPSVFE